MYVLLAGKPPFDGKDDKEILKKVKRGEIFLNTIEWRKRSKECIDLVKKLMSKDPEKRATA
jgi:calcium-dependent protein kinase